MPKAPLSLLLLLFLMLAPSARGAEGALDLLDIPVSYSADFTFSGPRGAYSGRVWHAPGRERREVATSGGGQGVLIDRAAGTAHFLSIGGKWHVALSLEAAGAVVGGLDSWTVERRRVGEDTVAGRRATRWATRASGPRGGFDGDLWISREGIVVKAIGTVSSPGSRATPVEMSLSGVKIGPVDPAMLAVPSGWMGFDLRQIPPERVVQAIEGLRPLLDRKN